MVQKRGTESWRSHPLRQLSALIFLVCSSGLGFQPQPWNFILEMYSRALEDSNPGSNPIAWLWKRLKKKNQDAQDN